MEILERLYDDLVRPATILLARMSLDVQQRTERLRVETVLDPASPASTILQSVTGLLAAGKVSQVCIPLEARRLVQQCAEIRPLAQLVVKLATQLDIENVSMAELAEDISVDPRITADLLKLTNSSEMGLRHKITRVFDAVNFLGVKRAISLVISASLVQTQRNLAQGLPGAVRQWYNRRSVLIASTAATFARNLAGVSADSAHVLGLFQDMGILILASAHGSRYLQLLQRAREIGQLRLAFTERQDFRVTHADVSAALLQKWGLPSSMVSIVLRHEESAPATEQSRTEQNFVHVMRIGEAVANLADQCHPQRRQALERLLTEYGPDQAPQCKAAVAESIARAVDVSKLFAIPVPDGETLGELTRKIADAGSESVSADEGAGAETASESCDPSPETFEPGESEEADEQVTTVLVVEDEPLVVTLIARLLKPAGLHVVSCADGTQAVALAGQADAVLCDVHLAGESGIGVIQSLRRSGYTGPVIAISGDRTRTTVGGCIEAGVTDYLLKPFDRASLIAKLDKHLRKAAVATL